MSRTHICSPCGKQFGTEDEYVNHNCEKSNHRPTDIEHLEKTTTPEARAIAEEAQRRGNEAAQG